MLPTAFCTFAFDLIGLALRLQLDVTGHLADHLLERAFDLLCRSGDSILVNHAISPYPETSPNKRIEGYAVGMRVGDKVFALERNILDCFQFMRF